MKNDEQFMKRAIELSSLAVKHGNEPFGAVLVKDNKIVFENENQIHTASDPTFHAELGLIRRFCSENQIEDLSDYTLYTSCEPCFMCSGAMVWSKLGRMVYAASNKDLENTMEKEGINCSEITFEQMQRGPEVTKGILRSESIDVLATYFGKKVKETKKSSAD